MYRLLIKNIGVLQTPEGSFSHRGEEQGKNAKLKDAAIYAEDGIIKEITSGGKLPEGAEAAARAAAAGDKTSVVIDAGGKLATPGLVDGHTHMVFGGYRQHEVPMKLKGATYLDILRAGGGILDTVRHTREAEEDELFEKSKSFLSEMSSLGVTTVEAKSGYGLDPETEYKMLRVIKKLDRECPQDVVSTFLGPHAVPLEYREAEPGGNETPEQFTRAADRYMDVVINEMLPYVKEHDLADYADVFTEDSVFNYDQSRRYLEKAKELGFGLKVHADEIAVIGGSRLAGELGAASAEHLISIDQDGLDAMAEGGVTAMCLPATSFYLGAGFAPARKMIEMGIPVACATDFNPGSSPTLNLQFVMNLAILKYRLLPEEMLTAVTINPACAIGMGDKVGTLEPGKQADVLIWDAPDLEMLCYRFCSNLVKTVIKKGRVL